jgi:hypothetical protein
MRHVTPKILLFVLAVVLAGCGFPGAPLPPSLELPQPVTDLRAFRKGDKVYLAWTVPAETTDRQSVRHLGPTSICRSLAVAMSECGTPVEEVPASQLPGPSSSSGQAMPGKPMPGKPMQAKSGEASGQVRASYMDTLPAKLQQEDPAAQITYAISVLNDNGHSAGLSNQVHVSALPMVSPPQDFRVEVGADGVRISWMCPSHLVVSGPEVEARLRIYRRLEGIQTDNKIAEVAFRDCSSLEFLDQTFDWEKIYYYRANVVTLISETGKPQIEVEGDDAPVVKLVTHDVFPPAVPSGLQAVFSGPGQQAFIDLIWAPDGDADLAGYNIHRHEEGGQPVKINPDLVKTPALRDSNVSSGKRYFYSVSAVDVRGNESGRSEETSEEVP